MRTLTELNRADVAGFVAVCGPLFEHSPWIAERAFAARPFASLDELHRALCGVMYGATLEEQINLIGSHPDLVGRLAREGRLSGASTTEQAAAGLTALSPEEIAAFEQFNAGYRRRFGFPFVICARENKKSAILDAFPERLQNTREHEITIALGEIAKIARLRLLDIVTESSSMPAILSANSYGKSDVRLTKVIRDGDCHHLLEFSIDINLTGDFAASYTAGDNTRVIATDSMKNTVYVLAKEKAFRTPEAFAILLAEHFVMTYAQVATAAVTVRQQAWQRIVVDGRPHDHAFVSGGSEQHVAKAVARRGERTKISSGLIDLLVLKTTRSAFKDFVTDRYRTLPDADDRIFATIISAEWDYKKPDIDFANAHETIRTAMLNIFATHMSFAVQQTMHEMGRAALAACPQASEIRLRLPNKHRIPVNLKPFGLENKNEVFVWTDEPFGDITATVTGG